MVWWCLCSALVVEKQPVMSSLPQRPLIVKTKVQFSVSVRCVFLQVTFQTLMKVWDGNKDGSPLRFLANLPNFKYLLKVKPAFDK